MNFKFFKNFCTDFNKIKTIDKFKKMALQIINILQYIYWLEKKYKKTT